MNTKEELLKQRRPVEPNVLVRVGGRWVKARQVVAHEGESRAARRRRRHAERAERREERRNKKKRR